MATTDADLDRFLEAAVRTGRMLVASDVYAALQERLRRHVAEKDWQAHERIAGIEVVECKELSPGTVMTGLADVRQMFDGMLTQE